MRVCVIRNAEAESNSDIVRSVDAFERIGISSILLTRIRTNKDRKQLIKKKEYIYKGKEIDNYEIQLYSEMDRGIKNLYQLFTYQFRVLKWLFKNRKLYDVIHSYDLDAGLPSIAIKSLLNKKVVYHISDLFVESRSGIPKGIKKLVRKIEYFVINKADATIICTEQRKNQIEGSRPKKLYVIHNSPVMYEEIKEVKKDREDRKINITYVGGLIDIRFIKEILEVVSEKQNIILNIAGIGPMSQYVEEYALKFDNINYLGKVSYNKALRLYNECDIMIAIYDPNIQNHKYSAPNKIYEAMMLGKPIVVAKGTGIDDIVAKENIGFVIEYSKDSFEKLIRHISINKSVLKEVGNKSKYTYNKYSWDVMVLKYKEIYELINKV